MPYTGAWRNQALFTNEALPLAPGADPSHMHPDAPSEGSNPPSGAPRLDLPPMFLTQAPDASYDAALDQPGEVLDQEPITHDAGDTSYAIPSPSHMANYGSVARNNQAPRYLRSYDEGYQSPRWELAPSQGDLTVATLRGDNSLPENNDDDHYPLGYRVGYSVKRFMNRRAFPGGLGDGWRTHTERWLRPGRSFPAAEQHSPAPTNPNRYMSPFAWNATQIGTRLQMPLLRRQPPAWSESLTNDGSDSSDANLDFVVG